MKPQDLVVLLFLASEPDGRWLLTYDALGVLTGVSASEVHKSLRRSALAGLYHARRRQVVRPALLEFVLHGLRYVFPAPRGPHARGIPTGFAAPPLDGAMFIPDGAGLVWPHEAGTVRGPSIPPLYRTVPDVAPSRPAFYALLALCDALRAGTTREQGVAAQDLRARLASSANT